MMKGFMIKKMGGFRKKDKVMGQLGGGFERIDLSKKETEYAHTYQKGTRCSLPLEFKEAKYGNVLLK